MTDVGIETSRGTVSGEFTGPEGGPVLVLAHGAGGRFDHPLLTAFADALAEAGIGCLRFNFVYSEERRKAPDREPLLREVWQAAFEEGARRGSPTWAGGGSMGGRIASMQVADGMPAAGLVFLAYPLHPPGKPERLRDEHLYRIEVPMLFLQGTKDAFARPDLLEGVLTKLGFLARWHRVEGADHSFRRSGGRGPSAAGQELAPVAASFILGHTG